MTTTDYLNQKAGDDPKLKTEGIWVGKMRLSAGDLSNPSNTTCHQGMARVIISLTILEKRAGFSSFPPSAIMAKS